MSKYIVHLFGLGVITFFKSVHVTVYPIWQVLVFSVVVKLQVKRWIGQVKRVLFQLSSINRDKVIKRL